MYFSDKQLAKKYGVHRSAIWRWVKNGNFPKPVKLSPGCTRWLGAAVDAWDQKKEAEVK
jgi:predicted DNA-binding transcriptional regulator AlpA